MGNAKQPNSGVKKPRSLRSASAPAMKKTGLALSISISTAMLLPLTAFAVEKDVELKTLKVEDTAIDPNPNAEPGVPYKAKYSGDQRRTKPLAKTPATIQVLTAEAIKDSGYTDLREILDSQPGITLGTGENGNAFGDRYIIRGQEARSDVFVDGLRDPGMTVRESFAIEQLEISKGPNSSFAGRGTAGGGINAVTKQATLDYNFTKLSTGVGSDDYARITVDTNQALTDTIAIRANALYHYEEVPDREPADRQRKGLALSGLITPTDNLDITLDYYGLRAEDNHDLGGYLTGALPHRRPARNPLVYVQREDFLESDVDTVTARINYRFSDTMRLSNLTRYGETDNGYVVTGARPTTTAPTDPNGIYDTVSLSTHNGWQEVEYFANQTNLYVDLDLAGMKHAFIAGLEYSDHAVVNGIYAIQNTGATNCVVAGRGGANPGYCGIGADGNIVDGLHRLMGRSIAKDRWDQDWSVETRSLYVMDTIDLTDQWTLFGGLRYDHFDFALKTQGSTLARENFDYSDDMFNGHLGVVYRINDYGNVYLSYGTSSDINGGESDVGTNSGYGGVVVLDGSVAGDPETSELLELGTKWDLFDERLLLTAALFQINKTDITEGSGGYDATGSFNSGENRVRGIEIGAVGEITEQLTVLAGATVMDAEVTKSYNAANEGKTLSNFAEKSAYVQLKYEFIKNAAIGASLKYEDEKFAGQPDTAPSYNSAGQYTQPVPSYTVYDLFAEYRFTENMDVRLNVNNITDKEYYVAGYRSGAFLYKGDARNFVLTLNYDF